MTSKSFIGDMLRMIIPMFTTKDPVLPWTVAAQQTTERWATYSLAVWTAVEIGESRQSPFTLVGPQGLLLLTVNIWPRALAE